MSVRLEIHQDRAVIEGPVYQVTTRVTYASGINRNIFVFNTETQDFEHVATVYDMETFPADRDEAILGLIAYYRKDVAIVGYTEETTAIDAADYTRERIGYLATQYQLAQEEFEGSEDYVYTGEN